MEVVSELSKTINESGGPADALGEGTALLNGSLSGMKSGGKWVNPIMCNRINNC